VAYRLAPQPPLLERVNKARLQQQVQSKQVQSEQVQSEQVQSKQVQRVLVVEIANGRPAVEDQLADRNNLAVVMAVEKSYAAQVHSPMKHPM
jgi:hypothetical protein